VFEGGDRGRARSDRRASALLSGSSYFLQAPLKHIGHSKIQNGNPGAFGLPFWLGRNEPPVKGSFSFCGDAVMNRR